MKEKCTIIGKTCPICNDVTSGIHYGIHTCESCKSFFKRAISFKKSPKFKCASSQGTCALSPATRSACQLCRFEKCIQAGMLPSLVRQRGERGGRAKLYLKC
ncbi:hypothetical protein O3G_MSEX002006 [Manduca sexta]|uniref:Nuclear receptor domain-containing protein n=1 Tax=Manduca sexta TaxID=7130 RepID=A0A921YLZ7_MANSE|nr:hypothetical protein O3G_MSEX002006 [Manduca sexta]